MDPNGRATNARQAILLTIWFGGSPLFEEAGASWPTATLQYWGSFQKKLQSNHQSQESNLRKIGIKLHSCFYKCILNLTWNTWANTVLSFSTYQQTSTWCSCAPVGFDPYPFPSCSLRTCWRTCSFELTEAPQMVGLCWGSTDHWFSRRSARTFSGSDRHCL